MERSDSVASTSSKAPGSFAYQQRLLERTSSRTGGGTLSRSSSITSVSSNGTGTSATGITGARRWTPTHKIGGSLDVVRGKWDERIRAEAAMAEDSTLSAMKPSSRIGSAPSTPQTSPIRGTLARGSTEILSTPSPTRSSTFESERTPTYLKRQTMPAPIIASPFSSNSTGITADDSDARLLPSSTSRNNFPMNASPQPSNISVKRVSAYAMSSRGELEPTTTTTSPVPRLQRASTSDTVFGHHTESSASSDRSSTLSRTASVSSTTSATSELTNTIRQRPASLYGGKFPKPSEIRAKFESQTPASVTPSTNDPPETIRRRPTSLYGGVYPKPSEIRSQSAAGSTFSQTRTRSTSPEKILDTSPVRSVRPPSLSSTSPPTSPSVMTPAPYTRPNKKSYGDSLTAGRKLGRHLPRIASGDAGDDWVAEDPKPAPEPQPTRSRLAARERRLKGKLVSSPVKPQADMVASNADEVTGIAGRLRLSRARAPIRGDAPLPSSRLRWGLWADTQRHLLQAYEYLCHVGEAQQWIEGCLGHELGFGVVDMEEGLRNGAVLARLVRVFQGEASVPRIWETPYPDWRHSDNVNYFFVFVRDPSVGLPESFIFEFTDLYNKKNLPKVIYCIHALSHLLARLGRAERIGNLLGQLKFSDDQLERTQKGLKDAGVAMPNFGNVGKTLALEINAPEEFETEIETEEERRDRLLLENEDSIIKLQSALRGFLVRKAQTTRRGELQLTGRHIQRLQAYARGALARRRINDNRRSQQSMVPWVKALQTIGRGVLVRRRFDVQLRRIDSRVQSFVKLQAHVRGVLVRQRYAKLKMAIARISVSVVKMQAAARAHVLRRQQKELAKSHRKPSVTRMVIRLQSAARGVLMRRSIAQQLGLIDAMEPIFISVQAQARGILVRRSVGKQLAKLDDVTDIIIRIQSFLRSYLARKRLLSLIRGLRKATPVLVQLQARARANLARQQHQSMTKALAKVEVVISIGGFQARARAALMRNQHREQKKQLTFAVPDVKRIQAAARGALFRREWIAWRDHIRRSEDTAILLQSLLRGVQQRKKFEAKMRHYRENMDKVVKIQSIFRAKETRDQYRQLTLGTNVTVGTIKNFVHLLDDSEADFQEEVDLERMRKQVVERIRENQILEKDVSELDVKIALVVNNAKTFEELKDARKRYGADTVAIHASRATVLAAHGDPFAGPNTLDHGAKRKLELYQQLFYLLQSQAEYLARLFRLMSAENVPDKDRRLLERIVLTLFGYGSDRREDFLLLKVLQYAIMEEVENARSISDVVGRGQRVWINITIHYLRHKQASHLRETLQPLLRDIVAADDLDLEADPVVVHRARMEQHEMRTGKLMDPKSKNVNFTQALADLSTRAEYIRHLQVLRWWAEAFVNTLTQSTRRMPYAIRYLARELLAALQAKFPDQAQEHNACIGRLVYYRYINPAVITPETFDIVGNTLDIGTRKNLAQISKVVTQITTGTPFSGDNPAYMPINEYVNKAISQANNWFSEIAGVPDAETQYHAHDFLDATVQPKPIYISPNEVYAMHGILSQHLDALAPSRDDVLRTILVELDGVPQLGNDELKDARDRAITLELTNRFANIKDPRAEEKTLWIQAKRTVLAILRVQPGKDLVESLMQPVTESHEAMWEDVLETEMEADHHMTHPRRMPSAVGQESAYRLEDIRALSFREVKAHAIYFLLELEKTGKITRSDGYQGILNAIANDVRSKHRSRLQRQQEIDRMTEALVSLNERKKHYLSQLESYSEYVEHSMATMQRGKTKKRITLPFTKQFFHERDLAKAGRTPQFGSFKYSASDLYDRGILLSVDGFSPLQFNKLDVVVSSDKLGVFKIEVLNAGHGGGLISLIGAEDVRMQDLLQAQFEEKAALPLYNGIVKFNLDLLLFQINKKFYV